MAVVEREPGTGVEAGTADPGAGHWRRKAVRGGGALIACKWLAQVLSWGVTLGVARLLAPEDYGVMAAAAVLLGLGDLFAEAGVGRALVQKPSVTESDYAQAFTLSLALAAACVAAVVAGSGAAARFWNTPELARVLPAMGALTLLVPWRTVALGILDRRLDLPAQGALHVVSTVVQSATVLTLAALGAGYWALVAGAVSGRVLESAALVKLAGWRPRLARPDRAAAGLLRYGLWVSGGTFLWYFYSNSDFAVVGRLEGPAVLGAYSLAFQLMSLPAQKVTANVNQVAFPVFCRIQGDRERVRGWFLRLSALTTAVALPTLLGAALVAGDAFPVLFGPRWVGAVGPFRWLCAAGVLGTYSSALVSLVSALGRPDLHFRYTAVCAVIFPLGFTVAGRAFGVTGVCAAWVVLSVLAVATFAGATRSLTGIGPVTLAVAQGPVVGSAMLMAAAVAAVQGALGDRVGPAPRLAAAVAAGVAAYGVGLALTGRRTVVADAFALGREFKGRHAP